MSINLHFGSPHSITHSSCWNKRNWTSTHTVISPYCYLSIVSMQVFCWELVCAVVLSDYRPADLDERDESYSWVLTSPLLSAASLVINACFYFDLHSILSSLVLSGISITSSFRLIDISLKISVSECFGSLSLILTFVAFFAVLAFPVSISSETPWPSLKPSL